MSENTPSPALRRWQATVDWAQTLAPVRIWQHYLNNRGPLMAGGMTYSSLFSVFAGLWIGFSVLGIFRARGASESEALITFINSQVPGLIDIGGGGVVAATALTNISTTLTWTSIVAAGGLLFTSMGWMRAGQNGVRAMFGLVGKERGPLLGQIINFGALILLAVLIAVGTAASVLTLTINTALLSFFGINSGAAVAISSHIAAGVVSVALDFVIIVMFVYVLAGVRPRWRTFWPRATVGAAAISAIKIGGSLLAGGATNNPLLASFAVFIGLMLWLNIINQTFFVCVAWLAVSSTPPAEAEAGTIGREAIGTGTGTGTGTGSTSIATAAPPSATVPEPSEVTHAGSGGHSAAQRTASMGTQHTGDITRRAQTER